ncbi:OsmC family protein [Microvirga sp. Mcv34]|uniref:OsmC family protein n=1 Tax=Microvirga sp. Mcv34 TaxID=2926016 RepID=UPI0021C98E0A|nr:OsmC family protein [Microvirga sp. Mcv34]
MTDLCFRVALGWHSQPADGEGVCIIGNKRFGYSAPAETDEPGQGVNPETLLLSAVGSCYSITLSRILKNAGLPFSRIHVTAEGSVSGFPRETRFTTILVHPEIREADGSRAEEYAQAAQRARERSVIGGVVRDSLDYRVGEVRLSGP